MISGPKFTFRPFFIARSIIVRNRRDSTRFDTLRQKAWHTGWHNDESRSSHRHEQSSRGSNRVRGDWGGEHDARGPMRRLESAG